MMLFTKSFFILLLCFPTSAVFAGEPQEGHGGDPYALEFVGVGRTIARFLAQLPAGNLKGFTAKEFSAAVETTRVVTARRVFLNGLECDAKNHSDRGFILLGRNRWKRSEREPQKRFLLALHEYLGMLNRDRKYEISAKFPELLKSYPNVLASVGGMKSCGLSGAIAERIADCESVFGPRNDLWRVVSRIEGELVIVKDLQTELIWSDFDRFLGGSTHAGATKTCEGPAERASTFLSIKGNLDRILNFQLPTPVEYEVAEMHDLRSVGHRMDDNFTDSQFWTSNVSWLFDARRGGIRGNSLLGFVLNPFRCVARER